MASRDKADVDTFHKCIQYALEKLEKSKSGFERTVVSKFKSKIRVGSGNESSNISKTTATNQCKRVPDLRRPGSVRIKRYYAKNGRLIPTAKRGKGIKQR